MQIATFDPIERILMDYINRARFYGVGSRSHRVILESAARMLDSKLQENPRDVGSQARLWAVLNREWLRETPSIHLADVKPAYRQLGAA